MTEKFPLSDDKKLSIVFRLEPGCLGPKGKDCVEDFCMFARSQLRTIDSSVVNWEIIPRFDKSLPELEYRITNRKLSQDKAARYLKPFNKSPVEFEHLINSQLPKLIEDYFKR